MRPRLVTALLCALSGLLVALTPAHAARFEIPVQGSRALTVAIAEPTAPAGDPSSSADTIHTTLERALDLTGYFELVPPAAHLDRSGEVEPGTFPWDAWTTIRAAALVKLRIWPAGHAKCDPGGARMCLDVYVYDVLGQEKLAGKRLRAEPASARVLALEAANEVLMALVGEPGFFREQLVAVRETGGEKDIWLVDLTGENPRRVTANGAIDLSPAWRPDKGAIAWTSYRRGDPDVWEKDLGSGRVRPIAARDGLELAPAYSPDGKLIAISKSEDGDTDIFLLDAATGKTIRRLTTGGGIDVSPHFSPDGRQIAFASERSGGSTIYAVDVAGGTPRRLTPMAGFFTDPVWRPDGQALAFVVRQGGRFDVLTVKADGTGMQRITQDMGDNEDPTWSPDGRYLVFSSTRDGRQRLWISTANGRHQVPLTTSTTGWSQPSWTR